MFYVNVLNLRFLSLYLFEHFVLEQDKEVSKPKHLLVTSCRMILNNMHWHYQMLSTPNILVKEKVIFLSGTLDIQTRFLKMLKIKLARPCPARLLLKILAYYKYASSNCLCDPINKLVKDYIYIYIYRMKI